VGHLRRLGTGAAMALVAETAKVTHWP